MTSEVFDVNCADHDGRSCLRWNDDDPDMVYHMIFYRGLSDQEWKRFQDRVDDRAWDKHRLTWNPEGIAALLYDITGDYLVEEFQIARKRFDGFSDTA